MNEKKRAVIYARVSTDRQTTDNQIQELERICLAKGWVLSGVFQDVASGSKGREHRPGLDAMLKDAARRKFDVVAIWSPDRLGRSQTDLLECLSSLHSHGCDLFINSMAIDTTTPAGRALFGMLGVFAEFERELIRSRVRAGLERAKAQGKKMGRPPLDPEKVEEVKKLRAQGLSYAKITEACGVSTSQIGRILSNEA